MATNQEARADTASMRSLPEPVVAARHALAVMLAVNSGATDAFGFLMLGGAFTSVMTGNMVLLGLAAGRADQVLAANASAAVVCFMIGCAIGTWVAGTATAGQRAWPARVSGALAVELVLFGAQSVGWWLTNGSPDQQMRLVLLSVNAAALGIQSSAVQRLGVSGLSTTYMTGTLTTMVIRVVSNRSLRSVAPSAQLLAGLIGGAAVMSLLTVHAPLAAPVVQLTSLTVVLSIVWITRLHVH